MIGLRVGLRPGLKVGIAAGLGADEIGGGPLAIVGFGQSNEDGQDVSTNLSAGNASFATSYPNIPIVKQLAGAADPTTTYRYYDGSTIHTNNGTDNPPSTFGAVGPFTFPSGSANQFGPWSSFARAIVARSSPIKRIVEFAIHGAGLGTWYLANHPSGGPPYSRDTFYSFVDAAGVTVGGLFASCGEQDATTSQTANAFAANVQSWISTFRAKYGNVPVIWARVHANLDIATFPFRDTVRSQLISAVNVTPYMDWIDVDSTTLLAGNVHLNADGQVFVGQQLDTQLAAMLVNATFSSAVLADSVDPVGLSASYNYTLDATVAGNAAVNVKAVLTLPTGVAFVSASGTGWTCTNSGQTVTCTRASGSVGALPTITVSVTSPSSVGSGSVTATATLVASNVVSLTSLSQTTTVQGPTFTVDATSGKAIPQNATEWSAFISANSLTISTPDSVYPLQDASGSPVDNIGSFPLTVSGTPAYQQSVTGWSSKCIKLTDGSTQVLASVSASLPDISTTSCLLLVYLLTPGSAPAGSRDAVCIGANTTRDGAVLLLTSGKLFGVSVANNATGAASVCDGAVHPFVVKDDHAAGVVRVATDADKLVITPSGSRAGKKAGFGSFNNATGAIGGVYAARWDGAKAEAFTDAVIKSTLQALGWTIPWT